jgi:hypothetical protein
MPIAAFNATRVILAFPFPDYWPAVEEDT